jgi:FdhD protein
MGQQLAQRLGLCTIGRAMNRRFLCYSAAHRLLLQPGLAGERGSHGFPVVAGNDVPVA